MKRLFDMLDEKGGIIVSSNECTPMQIELARLNKRMYVNEDGYGYIYFCVPPSPELKKLFQ